MRTTLAVFVCSLALAGQAVAADEMLKPSPTEQMPVIAGEVDWSLPPFEVGRPQRGAVLASLYVSFATVQAYDGYTTMTALDRGAREANPLLRPIAGHAAALWSVKGGSTALTIWAAERLWRGHHRGQAIFVMCASNAVMAAVAARNTSVLHPAH